MSCDVTEWILSFLLVLLQEMSEGRQRRDQLLHGLLQEGEGHVRHGVHDVRHVLGEGQLQHGVQGVQEDSGQF